MLASQPVLLRRLTSAALLTIPARAMATGATSIKLNDGTMHPVVGYGTYKVGVVPSSASSAVAGAADTEAVNPAECVAKALELGYRFLDCAEFCTRDAAVERALPAARILCSRQPLGIEHVCRCQ